MQLKRVSIAYYCIVEAYALQDSTVKELYSKVAAHAGEDESNFMLMLNGNYVTQILSSQQYTLCPIKTHQNCFGNIFYEN